MVEVKEVTCKSGLQRSGLEDVVYSLNPYRGCENHCAYCFSPSVLREERPWGTFVDVKRNLPTVLAKELKKLEKGLVQVGTVTDAYQPVEKKFEVTRRCLEQLLRFDWPITIQTKSALVERDIDLIKKFSEADVGMTITSMYDDVRRHYEPMVSPYREQLRVLKKFSDEGVETWVYIAPIVPFVTEMEPDVLASSLDRAGVKTVLIDRLRPKGTAWQGIERFIKKWRPDLVRELEKIRNNEEDYFKAVAQALTKEFEGQGIKVESYVDHVFRS